MAKMKIHEIAKSLQAQGTDIKSSDLIKLLNENGFEVKGANSNIDDPAIAFLLRKYTEPAGKPAPEAKKEKPKAVKTDASSENKKDLPKKPQEPPKDTQDKDVSVKEERKKPPVQENRRPQKNIKTDRNERQHGERGSERRQGQNGAFRGQSQGNRNNSRQQGGNDTRVLEKFKKSQAGFDGIKQEQKSGRNQRGGKDSRKDNNRKYAKEKKIYDDNDTIRMSKPNKKKDPNRKGAFIKPEVVVTEEPEDTIRTITLPEKITLKELGDVIKVPLA